MRESAHFERDAELLGFDGAQHVERLLNVLVEARVAAVEAARQLLAAQHHRAARAQTLPARHHLQQCTIASIQLTLYNYRTYKYSTTQRCLLIGNSFRGIAVRLHARVSRMQSN